LAQGSDPKQSKETSLSVLLSQHQSLPRDMVRAVSLTLAFMMASAVVQADECSSGGGCPSDNKPQNDVTLLQTNFQMNVFKHKDKPMPPRMSQAEETLFRKFLAQCKKYVEFGAGGSTVAAVGYPNLESIHVVESDPAWVNLIKERSDVMAAEETGRLHFHLVDIGKTGAWGSPVEPVSTATQSKFPSYSSAVGSIAGKEQLDCVLVDGRFRVACFLHALKHASPSTRLAVHDYTNRQQYHLIEKYADKVEVAEEMNVFKPKANINHDDIDRDIAEYEIVSAL